MHIEAAIEWFEGPPQNSTGQNLAAAYFLGSFQKEPEKIKLHRAQIQFDFCISYLPRQSCRQ